MALLQAAANVVDLIAETPLVKQALAERNAAVALQRKTQIGELRRLEREMARVYPGLEAAIAAAVSEVKQADAAAVAARRRFDRAVGAKAEAACRRHRRQSRNSFRRC